MPTFAAISLVLIRAMPLALGSLAAVSKTRKHATLTLSSQHRRACSRSLTEQSGHLPCIGFSRSSGMQM